MTLRKFNLLLISMILCSTTMMAQSKMKKSKNSEQKAVDAQSVEKEETEKVYTYLILDLLGKEGSYEVRMVIPKSNNKTKFSEDARTAEKKAAYAAQQQTYPTEIDFIKAMQVQMLELIAVTNDSDQKETFKRFYFKREVKPRM